MTCHEADLLDDAWDQSEGEAGETRVGLEEGRPLVGHQVARPQHLQGGSNMKKMLA